MTVKRDRDEQGRPRNARPRDITGRPLPRDATGVAPVDETIARSADDLIVAAQDALDSGQAFAAHELFEAAWRRADAPQRDLWQGLAQLAAGLTHLQRENRNGARALLQRGRERLVSYVTDPPYGLDVRGICAYAESVLDALASNDVRLGERLVLRG
ncbi:MAG: DUF309 domain-containing protein [Actinomycetes bacterium]